MSIYIYTREFDNKNYDPAAPIVELGVAKLGFEEPSAQLTALIDSGADATMLPIEILQNVSASTAFLNYVTGYYVKFNQKNCLSTSHIYK